MVDLHVLIILHRHLCFVGRVFGIPDILRNTRAWRIPEYGVDLPCCLPRVRMSFSS